MSNSLKGHCLVAMVESQESYFYGTVIYLLEHSQDGAFGFVINRPLNLTLDQLFSPKEVVFLNKVEHPVLEGGPVEQRTVFFLHQGQGYFEHSLPIGENLHLTTSLDLLASEANGRPKDRLLALLGYAGWGAGQLEQEIRENLWLRCPFVPHLLFETPFEERPKAAAALMGIELSLLASISGHD